MIIPKPSRWSTCVLQMCTIFSFALIIMIIGLIIIPKSDFHCVSSSLPSPITLLKKKQKERKEIVFFLFFTEMNTEGNYVIKNYLHRRNLSLRATSHDQQLYLRTQQWILVLVLFWLPQDRHFHARYYNSPLHQTNSCFQLLPQNKNTHVVLPNLPNHPGNY